MLLSLFHFLLSVLVNLHASVLPPLAVKLVLLFSLSLSPSLPPSFYMCLWSYLFYKNKENSNPKAYAYDVHSSTITVSSCLQLLVLWMFIECLVSMYDPV